jgi:hypothetical protein
MAGIAPHPPDCLRGIERARQTVARKTQPMDQLDEARAVMGRKISEQENQPAMAAEPDEQGVGCG